MKKFFFFLIALLPLLANASVKIGGIYYELDGDMETVTVAPHPTGYYGNIVIPESVTYESKTYIVIGIGSYAFDHCEGLTSITIPNSVASIWSCAFSYCSSLTSVTIPESVTTIGDNSFEGCHGLTSITIPEGITSINYFVFKDCTSLSSINIPSSVTTIQEGAFQNCSSLVGISIPESVTTIGKSTFEGCSNLGNATIGNGVTEIYEKAFCDCSSLASIDIPNSVKSIRDHAFQNCSALTSLSIGSGLNSIGYYENSVFDGCSSLTSITVDSNNTEYDSRNNCNAIIETATNTLLVGCNNTVIPEGVTSIGYSAFKDCASMISITIPNSVTTIQDYAFFHCSGLTSIAIPNSVVYIGNYAFDSCGLTSATIGNGIKNISETAFGGCYGITSLSLDCPVVKATWFNHPNNNIKELILGDNVISIDDNFFWYSSLTFLAIGKNVTSIGAGAFCNCKELTSVTIPESVTSIGSGAFQGCSGLTSFLVESGNPVYDSRENCNAIIETATNTLLVGCKNTVNIPNGIIVIDNNVFNEFDNLISITIPNSVTKIGYNAFRNCTGLKDIYCYAKEVPNAEWTTFRCFIYDEKGNTIGNKPLPATLHVPESSIDLYRADENWSSGFEGGIVAIEDDGPVLGQCAKPTISYANGKLIFTCETEGAVCQSTITDTDIASYSGNEVQLGVTYSISVYATKQGYENSEVATATLCWIDQLPDMKGIVEDEDKVTEVKATPVLIQSNGGTLSISGAPDGSQISVFDTNGRQIGFTTANGGITSLDISVKDNIAIVKIGDKAVKVLVK